jgi:hypothetical protein
MQAVTDGLGEELHVRVQKGDGAVARQVVSDLTFLVDGADETYQKGGKRLRGRGRKRLIENLS